MKIVCNASPLINLARIGKLGLLRELYEELIIPEAVWHEVVVEGAGQPGAGAEIGRNGAFFKGLDETLRKRMSVAVDLALIQEIV